MEKIKEFFKSKPGRIVLTAVSLLPALAALALAIYYIVGPGEGYLHSDCTDSMYWANATYESGKVFDETYRYAALLPFSAGLWMTPLIAAFGFGMTAHNVGMIIFAVLFAASIFFFCRSAKMSVAWSSVSVFAVFMILSSSDKLREILWGHAIYYSISMLILFFLLGLVLRWTDDTKKFRIAPAAVIAVFVLFLAGGAATDGFQVVAISTVPVCAALVAERLFCGEDKLFSTRTASSAAILALICVATVIGMALLSSFQGSNEYIYEYDAAEGSVMAQSLNGMDGAGNEKKFNVSAARGDTSALADREAVRENALRRANVSEDAAGSLKVRLCWDNDAGKNVYLVSFSVKKITSGYAAAYSGWSETSKWVENADKFLNSYLTLIGVPALLGDSMFSLESVVSLVRIVCGGLILIIPVAMLALYGRIRTRGTKMLLWSYWVVFGVIMLGFVCGKLSTANWRLTPIVGCAVLTTVAGLREAWVVWSEGRRAARESGEEAPAPGNAVVRFAAILLAVVLLSSAISANEVRKMEFDFRRDNVYHKCVEFLEEKGLEYGYATFWYSQVITMLSDSKAKTCEIMTNGSLGVYTDYYQSSRRWYEDDTHDKYFVLLTSGEYNTVKGTNSWKRWTESYLLESYEGISGYALYVFVFSENVLASGK